MSNRAPQYKIHDSIEEIERCLYRAQTANEDGRDEDVNGHLDEADSELRGLLKELSDPQVLAMMDRVVGHMERQPGLDVEVIDELFCVSCVSRQDLDAYRLAAHTPCPDPAPGRPRF